MSFPTVDGDTPIEAEGVASIFKLVVLSIIWAYLSSMTVPMTLDS